MTLDAGEFMRRFLLHVLPSGFHRIRHYGLLANRARRDSLLRARQLLVPLLDQHTLADLDDVEPTATPTFLCRHCGSAMAIVQILERACTIRAPPLGTHA